MRGSREKVRRTFSTGRSSQSGPSQQGGGQRTFLAGKLNSESWLLMNEWTLFGMIQVKEEECECESGTGPSHQRPSLWPSCLIHLCAMCVILLFGALFITSVGRIWLE